MYDIGIENKAFIDLYIFDIYIFLMASLFLPGLIQTGKDLYFLSLTAYHCGICNLGTYFVAYWSHCIKKGKNESWIK